MDLKRVLAMAALLVAVSSCFPADTSRGVGIAAGEPGSGLKVGKQYLVIIAVSKYQQWAPLSSPVEDTREIRDILVSRYCIDRVYELYDEQATKANIIKLFVKLQEEIQIDDSLLILYAGHGHLDKSSNTGFWIPVNAGTDVYEQQNWLPHIQLRGFLSNIRVSHLFVISDSCFAGDLIQATRSMPSVARPEYFQKAYSRLSRQVLTSGATEAVPDVSDFAYQLKSILNRNKRPYLDSFMLYDEVRLGMSSTVPLLGTLAGTGHQEGASFLFFLKPGLEGPQETPGFAPGAERPIVPEGRRKHRNYFSSGLGVDAVFPVASAANAFETSLSLCSSVHYDFELDWGAIGFGLIAGSMFLSTGLRLTDNYNITSIPLAIEVRYQTVFDSPIFFSVSVATGGAINLISMEVERKTVFKIFIAPSLGIGLRLFDRLRIAASLSYPFIFFDKTPYSGISTGIRAEYAFH
jgi:hypothetical protein